MRDTELTERNADAVNKTAANLLVEMMVVGKRYVVTKSSEDGTFEYGDHISINPDGSINDFEAQGWIEACEVAEATKGMLVEIDHNWVERRKQKSLQELVKLDAGQ